MVLWRVCAILPIIPPCMSQAGLKNLKPNLNHANFYFYEIRVLSNFRKSLCFPAFLLFFVTFRNFRLFVRARHTNSRLFSPVFMPTMAGVRVPVCALVRGSGCPAGASSAVNSRPVASVRVCLRPGWAWYACKEKCLRPCRFLSA